MKFIDPFRMYIDNNCDSGLVGTYKCKYDAHYAVVGFIGKMNIFYKEFVEFTGINVKVCDSKDEAKLKFS